MTHNAQLRRTRRHVGLVVFGLGITLVSHAALAEPETQNTRPPVRSSSEASPPKAEAKQQDVRSSLEFATDVAPPSSWDLAQGQTGHIVHPETTILMWQLVRTVFALAAVLALIFVLAKVLLPKLTQRFALGDQNLLQVKSRLRLDETHQVVLLEVRGRDEVLIALGPGGAQLICPVAPLSGNPKSNFAAEADRLSGSL